MEIKEMRQALRDAGVHMPRANADVMPAYYEMLKKNEAPDSETVEVMASLDPPVPVAAIADIPLESPQTSVVELVSTNVYTYIGSGDEPPYMINFMGKQKFVRGQATEVTNPEVAKKVARHRCFVKGTVDLDAMFKNDELERVSADEQRKVDAVIQAKIDRVYKS